jgi:transposase-like protein
VSHQRYTPEFKDEAVRQVTEMGPLTAPLAWVRAQKKNLSAAGDRPSRRA